MFKEFLVNGKFKIAFFLLFILTMPLRPEVVEEYYRSNYNGLLLLKIDSKETGKYEYVIKDIHNDGLLVKRILYKGRKIEKQWDYFYTDKRLTEEIFYKNGKMEEQYFYDGEGHKINQREYRNGSVFKNISYTYNKDGLVEKEIIEDRYLGRTNQATYRYDNEFRIKQIIREMHDGKVIYWDAFFTGKGIVAKEYYTIGNENYIFYYSDDGQELKGEVIEEVEVEEAEAQTETVEKAEKKVKTEEKVKLRWENKYSVDGKKIFKEEINYKLGKKIKTWYDPYGRESKNEFYTGEELVKIEERTYFENGNLASLKEIASLNVKEWKYKYNEDDAVIRTDYYENSKLKSKELKEKDGSREVIVYGANQINIFQKFDPSGNKIEESIMFE